MRQRSRWKPLSCLLLLAQVASAANFEEESARNRNAQKGLFSPRMDYNQWKPLGRGDPLKNDPTFDYVPPALDRVHYWVDTEPHPQDASSSSRDPSHKSEILLLGVASKKPAVPSGFNQQAIDRRDSYHEFYSPNQRIARPNYFPSMTSQIVPNLVSLANQVLDRTLFSKVPYTVLMPPPKDQHALTSPMTQRPHFSTPLPQGGSGVTVEESNLVYQSSSHGGLKDFEAVPSISWELPATTEASFMLAPPKSFMRIQFAPQNYSNKILEASGSNQNINYVTPPPLADTHMTYKGHVSDDNDIADSYVKIEKPQAQMDHMGVEINNVHPMPFRATGEYNSMQMIRDMETLQPPPVTHSPVYVQSTNPVVRLLEKDLPRTTPKSLPTSPEPTTMEPISTITPEDFPDASTTEVTTMQTLTTDPLFKHYKQPIEPMKGPLYLIIQGHSKVKTYKPANQIDGVPVQETNEIPYNVDFSIKHLHGFEQQEDFLKNAEILARKRQARNGNLQTLKHLVQTGFGRIDVEREQTELKRRSDGDVGETELERGYEVVDGTELTTERYMKGIVEEA
ncbi:hypothetical protein HUJ04_006316 [Dendroctonus ponderosae]|uniref:DUF4794 domain-containing protein n=1 Tax=Dendroctonus ponderosae TaxID=77166 RepID=A0AAR5PNB1_DENPD|nr:hypothetical protein HUJ04_006316 [Dendroctonus ponderosae]